MKVKLKLIYFRYSDQLEINDKVLVQRHDDLIPVEVINISSVIMQGSYWF